MNYRNPKLLQLAKHCPKCMYCGKHNDGTVVAAHSNQQRDGKGTGIKAHDYRIAYLCYACHTMIDSGACGTKEQRAYFWDEAHRRTVAWLFESGAVTVNSEPKEG
jgi:hypothetical protein